MRMVLGYVRKCRMSKRRHLDAFDQIIVFFFSSEVKARKLSPMFLAKSDKVVD